MAASSKLMINEAERRFPVRIKLEEPPQPLMRLGASAVVEIKHGNECR